MSDPGTGNGKVVVNRAMSLDGFIAGPGDAMDWIFEFMGPVQEAFPEIMAATGAMLVGRRTYEVGKRLAAKMTGPAYDGGPQFVLTHQPPDPPDPTVTFLSGDITEAVATARRAAGGKNLEILGADVAGQCLRARTRRRDPGVRPAGAARRRHPLLIPGSHPDRPGTCQQHPVGTGHHHPVPRPQVTASG